MSRALARISPRGALVALFALLCVFACAPSRSRVVGSTAQQVAMSDYAGDVACAVCHEFAFQALDDQNHAPRKLAELDPRHGGCESCHGPARAHAESGGAAPLKFSPQSLAMNASCLLCHAEDTALTQWERSTHARSALRCADCHPPGQDRFPARALDLEQRCAKCHPDVAAQFRLPNHHPWAEGAVSCADCHDPHHAGLRVAERRSEQRACLECHREKGGPFVFSHAADRADGCVICHLPHGSLNRRLLPTAELRQLCLGCHPNTPPSHDQSPGSIYRNCIACHTEIHGSHWDRHFLR